MNEPTEIKYSLDENGELYFAATHIDAVQGFDASENQVDLTDINNKITQLETLVKEQDKALKLHDLTIGDMVGDTGWIDIDVPPTMKNNANSSGFKCGIREVRAGNSLMPHRFIVRSIRLNVSNITGDSMQIAQLPTGFVINNQSFMARQNGFRHPVTIECLNNGKVMAYVHPDDQSKTNWVYQEFTWLE